MNTTCQICGRIIQAKTGLIAHHGYTRPNRGSGWQTASCWGARHLPYERSCDQIAPCIKHIQAYVKNQEHLLKYLMDNPPGALEIPRYGLSSEVPAKFVARPADFNPKENERIGSFPYRSYESIFHGRIYTHRAEIASGEGEIKRLKKRLQEWKPPSKP